MLLDNMRKSHAGQKWNKMHHCAWAQIEASVDDDEYGLLLMNNGAACFVHCTSQGRSAMLGQEAAKRSGGNVALSIPIEDP